MRSTNLHLLTYLLKILLILWLYEHDLARVGLKVTTVRTRVARGRYLKFDDPKLGEPRFNVFELSCGDMMTGRWKGLAAAMPSFHSVGVV